MEEQIRRSRLSTRRQPTGKNVVLTPRDYIWLKAIHDHGALPTSILTAFTAHLYSPRSDRGDVFRADKKNHDESTKRLKRLFHEGDYLTKHHTQFETAMAERHYVIYGLSEKGREVLGDEGSEYGPRTKVKILKHDVMYSCVTASIELATKGTDVAYIPQHEAIGIKAKGLTIENVLDHSLVPDAVFGLSYSGKKRYYCVEADRSNETEEATKGDRKDIKRNYIQYREFIGGGHYKDHYGITQGMMVLNITTSAGRMLNMMEVVKTASKSGQCNFMLYQTAEQFGRHFEPPHEPLTYLFTDHWHRAGLEPFPIHSP